MLVKTYGSAVHGVDAITITIEVDVNNQGQFAAVMVGLPDCAVKESMMHEESSVKSNGYKITKTHGVLNLNHLSSEKILLYIYSSHSN